MAKYDPLRDRLMRGQAVVYMTFNEIADLVEGLPSSAHQYREWWANESDGRHVQAKAWLTAGYSVIAVDFEEEVVRFGRGKEGGSDPL